ncbi:recombinase family protein [Limimaricola sp. G21655-S1]|uniref:recombinase family protein n=1 Tax=Limimaricola sp. G21655-S1 TaxID=3014768 RepID=UPI0022AED615|nr:recombinase family protein [Limimaricola sp. G21655-S1]MCZ4263037.1 recombinase family protein [Limimaricola sp. G21655-S1]
MTTSHRVALYARYSSDNQRDASIEDHLRLCRERAAREGWEIIDSYSDRSISGASLIRPGIQALMQDAQVGRFDVVLAESLDRISRDQEDIAGVYKRLSFADVRLVTLTEGEVSELHIGLKGTMGALFLKDLADKTRRGLRGRVAAGKSGGGNSYGYRVVRDLGPEGLPVTGERAVEPTEARIVARIFRDYAGGASPRSIAHALNAEGLRGPRSEGWSASSIHGNRARGTGILNNELYIGRLVWNRLRYVKDPETGRRVSRRNPESAWIVTEVPELRIIPQELWDTVKARQGKLELPQRGNRGHVLNTKRRARYLLSGLMRCGACGGGMSMISATHLGCSGARNKGTCGNRKTIARREVEERVCTALSTRLMERELFTVFCEEFVAETNRLRAAQSGSKATTEAELVKVKRDLERLVQALLDGVPAASVRERMQQLEVKQAGLERKLEATPPALPALHPDMAKLYREKVATLLDALNADDSRSAATEILRGLIDSLVLTPTDKAYQITLTGDLAGILGLAAGEQAKTSAGVPAEALQVSLVAGAGFDETRTAGRLRASV